MSDPEPTNSPELTQLVSRLATSLDAEAAQARRIAAHARAEATEKAYLNDWRHFCAWCRERQLEPLPAAPETLVRYIASLGTERKKASTIERRLASIRILHQVNGHEAPTRHPAVAEMRRGARRLYGVAPTARAPALAADIINMIAALPETLIGVRDRALLLVGFAGAFRRAELVGVDAEHLRFDESGVRIRIPRSKTDQEGAGEPIGIRATGTPTCPVAALRDWLDRASIASGPVFRPVDRHGKVAPRRLAPAAVAMVVKRSAAAAGLDPAWFAGHSLRAGLVTEAFARGASEADIMRQTRHKDSRTLRRYRREGRLWINNVTENIGL